MSKYNIDKNTLADFVIIEENKDFIVYSRNIAKNKYSTKKMKRVESSLTKARLHFIKVEEYLKLKNIESKLSQEVSFSTNLKHSFVQKVYNFFVNKF